MGASFTIARIFGIAVRIHISWLLIIALLSWTLAEGAFPSLYDDWSTQAYWIVGTISAVLLFVAVLLHEMAHALVAIRRGLPVPSITLFFFGGVSHLGRQPESAGEEVAIAIAGPLTSFGIAVVTAVVAIFAPSEYVRAMFGYLATVNVALGVFNLLPGFPLDGGRVLRGIAWRRTGNFRRATRIAASVGEYFAYGLFVLGAVMLLSGLAFNGLWFILIGWFVLSAARGEAQAVQMESLLGKLTAADVMDTSFSTVPPDESLQRIVDDWMLAEGQRAVLVVSDGRLEGLLSVSDVRKVERDQWSRVSARQALTPAANLISVGPEEKAVDVLGLIGEKRLNQVPVVVDGRAVGVISRRELVERLQVAEIVGPDPA